MPNPPLEETPPMSAAPLLVLISLPTSAATEHACASHARERAAELLLFHSHGDDRVEIGYVMPYGWQDDRNCSWTN